jgi:hypothetical protein
MFYTKNVPGWERILRTMGGAMMMAGGLMGMPGSMAGKGVAAMGMMLIATGFVGFCPACALVGRKLDRAR